MGAEVLLQIIIICHFMDLVVHHALFNPVINELSPPRTPVGNYLKCSINQKCIKKNVSLNIELYRVYAKLAG